MTTLRVRKTRLTEAVQINTPEDEETVLSWIREELGKTEDEDFTVDLEPLKAQHVYFMRDEGSAIVYITSAADFLNFFEEADEENQDLGFTF